MIKPKALNLIKDATPLPPLTCHLKWGGICTHLQMYVLLPLHFFLRESQPRSFLTQPRVLFPYRS